MTRYEAFIDPSWRTNGMANLLVARIRENGRTEIGVFLIDCWCLGVKDAYLIDDTTEAEYRAMVEEQLPESSRELMQPACAKKFIEEAVAYAQALGFAPHRDFRKARRVLGGTDAGECPETFAFGRNGRPCFVQGPDDTEERVARVCAILDARVGPEGYDVVLLKGDEEDGDDSDDPAAELDQGLVDLLRERITTFLDNEPDEAPGFYAMSGLFTALHVCPRFISPEEAIARALPAPGRDWRSPQVAETFTGFAAYWAYVGTLLVTPDRLFPFDINQHDFDTPADAGPALIEWANGFLLATTLFPAEWIEALAQPELAEAWLAVRAWADPARHDEYFQRFLNGRGEGFVSLPNAVRTLRDALTQERDASWPSALNPNSSDDN